MHVGRGERHVAQARHPELAEVALAQANVAGLGGGGASGIVVEAAQQGVRARAQLADAAVPAGIDPAGLDEMRHAGIGELAVGKGRAEMAEEAVAPADEQAQAAHGGGGIAGLAGRIVARQGVAEIVERRAVGDPGFQERRQCLAEIDEHPCIVRTGCCAERAPVAAGELPVGADQQRRAAGADAHFTPVEQGAQILRPQRVLRAVPAEPAIETQVEQAGRVAVDGPVPAAARQTVGPGPIGPVAGCAGDRAGERQARLEEQRPAEGDGGRFAGHPVARIGSRGRRPRSVAQDPALFLGGEVERRRRRSGAGKDGDAGKHAEHNRDSRQPGGQPGGDGRAGAPRRHSGTVSAVSFSRPAAPRTSRMSCQRPGMWNSRPSAVPDKPFTVTAGR